MGLYLVICKTYEECPDESFDVFSENDLEEFYKLKEKYDEAHKHSLLDLEIEVKEITIEQFEFLSETFELPFGDFPDYYLFGEKIEIRHDVDIPEGE